LIFRCRNVVKTTNFFFLKIEQFDVWWCSDRRYLTFELMMTDDI